MSLVHLLSLIFGPLKLHSVPFLENLQEFHFHLGIQSYSNSPQMSCLGMNSGRGWNPNLEGSYLLEYSEYKAEFWLQCTSGFYIQPLRFSASDPLPISGYGEFTKT